MKRGSTDKEVDISEETKDRAPVEPKAPDQHVKTLSEMVNAASALALLNQQAAREAMQLPNPRLDDASDSGGARPYTLRVAGVNDDGEPQFVRVDSEGRELGKATRADLGG